MGVVDPHAMTKLFSKKPSHAEALVQALGCVWQTIKVLGCKDLGGNLFIFSFDQARVGEEEGAGTRPLDV